MSVIIDEIEPLTPNVLRFMDSILSGQLPHRNGAVTLRLAVEPTITQSFPLPMSDSPIIRSVTFHTERFSDDSARVVRRSQGSFVRIKFPGSLTKLEMNSKDARGMADRLENLVKVIRAAADETDAVNKSTPPTSMYQDKVLGIFDTVFPPKR
jgi:hypothetical protein